MIKIAIPMASSRLCMHFGHCEEFAFFEVDEKAKRIIKMEKLVPPPHEPGVIPRWIAENGAKIAIVGGMGPMAQQILAQMGVTVIAGVQADTAENIVNAYLSGKLECGINVCDHENHKQDCHG